MREFLRGNLSPFCSADSAKRGEGETLAAFRDCEATGLKVSVNLHPLEKDGLVPRTNLDTLDRKSGPLLIPLPTSWDSFWDLGWLH
jgi:hypothetical protein